MSLLSDLATGGVGTLIETVVKGASELVTTDKERLAAEAEMERLGIEREKAYLADVDSARRMQMEALKQDDLFAKRFVYWFSIAWSLFAMVFLLSTTFMDIPEKNIRTVDTVLGFLLGTAISSIFSYFLGTSYTSRRKDDTISQLSANK
ncbi:MAG: hypothetical protein ACKO0Z_02715 [Betaproteobacteria bacterium]